MSTFNDSTPIATPEQYRAALLAARALMTDIQLAMLQAHCKSADHAISASQLAELFGIATVAAANTKYCNYARLIADALNYTPLNHKSKPCWWLALAYGRPDADKVDGEYEWIMRPELVETLQSMRWA